MGPVDLPSTQGLWLGRPRLRSDPDGQHLPLASDALGGRKQSLTAVRAITTLFTDVKNGRTTPESFTFWDRAYRRPLSFRTPIEPLHASERDDP